MTEPEEEPRYVHDDPGAFDAPRKRALVAMVNWRSLMVTVFVVAGLSGRLASQSRLRPTRSRGSWLGS